MTECFYQTHNPLVVNSTNLEAKRKLMLRFTLLTALLAGSILAADTKSELQKLFDAIDAAGKSHDADAYNKLLAADFHQVTRSGRIRDRKAAYEAEKNGPPMPADIKFEEVNLAVHGDSAIRIQTQSWTTSAGKSLKGYLTTVFVKENGVWKLAGMFSTDIPTDTK